MKRRAVPRVTGSVVLAVVAATAWAGSVSQAEAGVTAAGVCAGTATVRASVGPNGRQANDMSLEPSISGNGRFVAFHSTASNLVRGDTNDWADIFVYDRVERVTTRVSVSSGGGQADHFSALQAISRTGRYVVFTSNATNLVPRDTNGMPDVFIRDRATGRTGIISVSSTEQQGRNRGSSHPSVSADGRYVAFVGYPRNLVAGDTNGVADIFVRDRQRGTTTRVSVSSTGQQANKESGTYSGAVISANGRFVVFESDATNLVRGDTNRKKDVFAHDRVTHKTTRISVGAGRAQANNESYWPSISADGRYVAFSSRATNLVQGDVNDAWDVFVRDRRTGTTTLESRSTGAEIGNDFTYSPMISGNGGFLTWWSYADNLVPGDTNQVADVFVRNRSTGRTWRLPCGTQPDGESILPEISDSGQWAVYESEATNLVTRDTNRVNDVFLSRAR